MKLAIEIGSVQPEVLDLTTEWVQLAERLGVDMAFSAEAWWSDAATPLAYLADKTERIKLATGIMQITARTPAMTAMTALTLHDFSDGRFVLGLGASGPQVVEGFTQRAVHDTAQPAKRNSGHLPHDFCRREGPLRRQGLSIAVT